MQLPFSINTADYPDFTSSSLLARAIYRCEIKNATLNEKSFGASLGLSIQVAHGVHAGKMFMLYFNIQHNTHEKAQEMAATQISTIVRAAAGKDGNLTDTDQLRGLIVDLDVGPEPGINGKINMKFFGAVSPTGEAPDNQPEYQAPQQAMPTPQTTFGDSAGITEIEPTAPVQQPAQQTAQQTAMPLGQGIPPIPF